MTDDIVTRLREEADSWCHDSAVRVFLEAADEIERLRAELSDWRETAMHFVGDTQYGCNTCEKVRQAVQARKDEMRYGI